MASSLIRIFSDLHYGDRATSLHSLSALQPLFDGASDIVVNGDALDTRPSPSPQLTAALRSEVLAFFQQHSPRATLLTGNHDPDIGSVHHLDFPAASLFVTHGDALFDDLVPWSQDAPLARKLVAAELAAQPASERESLSALLTACRRAAALIPQRHQSEPHGLKYLIGFARDTVWPPSRILRVLRAWRETPLRAAAFLQRHRPNAKFLAMGHTHRLGAFRAPSGKIILNTGAFCPPCAPGVIDLCRDRLSLRRVERRRGEFRLGPALAEFALAD
ncbi:MAG TPA: hypothetical protein VEQ65_12295 [Opitutus sp.]|nr:hypothetical protein [Opitutus sp.]